MSGVIKPIRAAVQSKCPDSHNGEHQWGTYETLNASRVRASITFCKACKALVS